MATRTRTGPPEYTRHLLADKPGKNFSDRLFGSPVQAIAVHSTESDDRAKSWDDLHGVRSWFDNPVSDASSHLGIDGDGHTELWVPFAKKAWTILQLNSVTVNIEFVGRAAQPSAAWEEAQVKAGARWAAYLGVRFDIPMQRGIVRNINGAPVITRKGIITHKQLTDAGFGTHVDPGPKFPMADFLDAAQWYRKNGWVPNGSDPSHP